jgi:hypothetical protein
VSYGFQKRSHVCSAHFLRRQPAQSREQLVLDDALVLAPALLVRLAPPFEVLIREVIPLEAPSSDPHAMRAGPEARRQNDDERESRPLEQGTNR